ncbi:hypothetical protein CCACVL1_06933 [Corchorus capsularis]|uniref:Uncharacterized protein n=1 Tax=Corchorus capsularis TaxID=210143 RepID=A0A1R3JB25_COCAP|nr:hypothetical protein CCACVL1_06933 [Corchorus capsularis]
MEIEMSRSEPSPDFTRVCYTTADLVFTNCLNLSTIYYAASLLRRCNGGFSRLGSLIIKCRTMIP